MQKAISGLPLALLLAALAPAAAGAAPAATSKALLRAGSEEPYLALKRTFQTMFDDGAIQPEVLREEGAVDLESCTYGATYLGSQPSARTAQLANLAYEVVRLKQLLTELGYPAAVWRPALLDLEAQGGFDVGASEHLAELSETLNAHRRASAPSLPRTVVVGGCGEGEVGVQIVTRPRRGRVRLIPVFLHRLCKAQKIDPDDPRQCDHWLDALEGARLDVSGDYFFRASWPDGVVRTGRLSFTNAEDGDTVPIDKP